MAKLPVLFIHHGTIIGGAPVSLALQVQDMAERGKIGCRIACNSGDMRAFFSRRGLEAVSWPYTCTFFGKVAIRHSGVRDLHSFFLLVRDCILLPVSIVWQVCALIRCDERIVHLNSAVLFTSAFAAKITGRKIVWHIREASRFPYLARLFITAFADAIICISETEASRFNKNDPKIHVVYNPVDFSRFDPGLYDRDTERGRLGIPADAKVIVSLGGVTPRKGAKEILEALEYCDPGTFAVIAGPPLRPDPEDRYQKETGQLVRRAGENRVIFTGIVENPAPLLAAADLLVFAGLTPHFPRPVYEAWAMKKPVVVFPMEGISNNVEHMTDGIVATEISAEALGRACRHLLADRELQHAMGVAGYGKARARVLRETSSGKIEEILLGVGDSGTVR